MNLETRVKRSDRPLTSPVADELVMFDAGPGKYYGLNDIATEIWDRLEQPVMVEELCRSLTEEFEVSAEQCQKEVLEFLPKLKEKGLIEEVNT